MPVRAPSTEALPAESPARSQTRFPVPFSYLIWRDLAVTLVPLPPSLTTPDITAAIWPTVLSPLALSLFSVSQIFYPFFWLPLSPSRSPSHFLFPSFSLNLSLSFISFCPFLPSSLYSPLPPLSLPLPPLPRHLTSLLFLSSPFPFPSLSFFSSIPSLYGRTTNANEGTWEESHG